MKITKSQLKQIIKEEIEEISEVEQLNENPAAVLAAIAKYGPMIMQVVDIIKNNPEIVETLKGLIGGATPAAGGTADTTQDLSPASE